MRATPLDPTDIRLVHELEADGRASYVDLAAAVGLSPARVRERVRRLLDDGAVTIVGIASPAVLGIEAIAVAGVEVDGAIARAAAALAEIEECAYVAATLGRYGVLVEVQCRSNVHMLETLDRMRSGRGVRGLEAMKYAEVVTDVQSFPPPPGAAELDEADRALLQMLEGDGRMSYARLGAGAGLSHAAARNRVHAMIERGSVRIAGLADPMRLGIGQIAGVGLRVAGAALPVAKRVGNLAGCLFAATVVGPFDVFATVAAPSDGDIRDRLDEMAAWDGVVAVEAFPHLALVKERYPVTRTG